jgi:hypothetical protein
MPATFKDVFDMTRKVVVSLILVSVIVAAAAPNNQTIVTFLLKLEAKEAAASVAEGVGLDEVSASLFTEVIVSSSWDDRPSGRAAVLHYCDELPHAWP